MLIAITPRTQAAIPIWRGYAMRTASGRGGPSSGLGSERNGNSTRPTGPERWPLVSVVMPTLNEAQNLPSVLPRIPMWVHEVVVVDGGSTDGTVDIVRRLRDDAIVVHQRGRGKGDALITGFAAATGELIVTIDADGSTDPAELPAFVGALLSGADFAKGSRFLQGGGSSDMEWYRCAGNHALRMVTRWLFGGQFSDLCYGFNALWRTAVDRLDLDCDGFEIETLIALRALKADLRITEVASYEEPRIHGVSHLRTIRDGGRVLRTILAERFTRRRWLPEPWPVARPSRPGEVVPATTKRLVAVSVDGA